MLVIMTSGILVFIYRIPVLMSNQKSVRRHVIRARHTYITGTHISSSFIGFLNRF